MDFIREQWQITKIIAISFVPAGAARKLTPGVSQRYDYYVQKNGDYFDEVISAVRYLAKNIRIKPRVFVGSTREKLDVAHIIEENLEHAAECTVWDQDVFRLSKYNLESLIQVLGKSRYAIFAFTPDDMVKIRGNEYPAARDNVIFEVGLAMGMLGREHVFLVSPSEPRGMWIPTDLFGITIGSYEGGRSDGNWVAALGPFCNKVKRLLEFPEQ
jgi:predicted nucleotide-binding protein